jgi:hypothetical protein
MKAVKRTINQALDYEAGFIKYETLEDVLQEFLYSTHVTTRKREHV